MKHFLKITGFLILSIILSFIALVGTATLSHAFQLPDTGQTKCYQAVSPYAEIPCAGTGQDGEYSINPMSYTDNGNGTVTDKNTGLMWQRCSVGQNNDSSCSGTAVSYNWYQASGTYNATYNPSSQDICGSLSLGGYTDWRLPSRKELITIAGSNSAIFQGANDYWSSNDLASRAYFVYLVSGNSPLAFNYVKHYVRCVRGEQYNDAIFTDNGNGTVTDNKTSLIWQQGEPGLMTWNSALSYCEALALVGNTDWRLPNYKELASITNEGRDYPAINTTFFPVTYPTHYWSSTNYTGFAQHVCFCAGEVEYGNKAFNDYVRCVRGGQPVSFDHFEVTDEFGNAITNKSINEQFQIKVTARNADGTVKTDWTGTVYISATNGGLSYSSILITSGGTATSTVSIDTPGAYVSISAMGGGMSGASGAFNVTGGAACNGSFGGTVKQYKAKLAGATVNLAGYNYSNTTTSLSDGSYSFGNVPAGSYTLSATYNGGESGDLPVNIGGCGGSKEINVYAACNTGEKTPVLLVPGLMGSTLKNNPIELIPTLHNKGFVQSSEMKLYDNKSITNNGWQNLKSILEDYGYKEGCTMFEVPYDWRRDIRDTVKKYIRPAIVTAKQKAGSLKVNIIAHSMGGIVTRSYIQGFEYQNDIDRFAMIGTPNKGSEMAYPLWDGGDPFTADFMAMFKDGSLPVYTPTLVYLVKGPDKIKWATDYLSDKIAGGLCKALAGGYGWLCTVADAMFPYKDIATYTYEALAKVSKQPILSW